MRGFPGLSLQIQKGPYSESKTNPQLWGVWEGWAGTQEWVEARVATALGLGADKLAGGPTGAQRKRSQLGDSELIPPAFIGS